MSWNATSAIRARREKMGISQSELAKTLGVSKSLLSHIESGSRQPTREQIRRLADALQMPDDLLVLGLGRLPDDIAQALEQDPAEFAVAVRSRFEANAIRYPTAPSRVLLTRPAVSKRMVHDLPETITTQKTSTSYRAHSYHTKIPPEAIRPFIRAFTKAGETVLDPFCGSGMTGVASLIEGRNALLSDLSPAAVHIARNYTCHCDPKAFKAALARIEQAVGPIINWLYRPSKTGEMVEYTTWSDAYRCPSCRKRFLYWDALQQHGSIGSNGVVCPSCKTSHRKTNLEWVGEAPVQSHVSSGSNRITSHKPTRDELALIQDASATPIPYWTPSASFGSDREMWRAAHTAMGIQDVSSFFTRRNLHALAALRHAIVSEADVRVREALMFAFTACVNRASKRYQWNAKRPTNVMTGTLYISSLRYEWNVWSLFKRKAADVLRYYEAFPKSKASAEVFQSSATALGNIPDQSVDMVFMDPPFGSNIFYADASLLWDAWLGELTDPASEIVVNKHRKSSTGGKVLADYEDLMAQSFSEAARVLKRGGRAVLAFSNSDDRVWQSVQRALATAGFETDTAHILSKGQASIKGVKGRTGKENVTTLDLLLCLKQKKRSAQLAVSFAAPTSFIDYSIRAHFAKWPGDAQALDQIYSSVVRDVIVASYSVTGITMPAVAERCKSLGAHQAGHRWLLSDKPLGSGDDFVSGYLSDDRMLPASCNRSQVKKPISRLSVPGGRGNAFYLAHSYHTKVPPEAIAPFIRHYTKPGDVVFDPFCGSGMTGVAASLEGRRSILSDLSPAAIHLSWNHTRPCSPEDLGEAFRTIQTKLKDAFARLYETRHSDGTKALIQWTLWSTEHACPNCSKTFKLWEAVDQENGRLGQEIDCPRCGDPVRRRDLSNLGSSPAWIAYDTSHGKRFQKAAEKADIRRSRGLTHQSITEWFPTTEIDASREMYIRCALQLQGIKSIPDFYTARNLQALALLWKEINAVPDERIKRALAFAFTNTAWHGTRMRRFNARGGQRPLTGTLYVPQLSIEVNVMEVMANKIAQLKRYFRTFDVKDAEPPALFLASADHIPSIPDGSVDYIFTDPPFGSNIFYADCNLIWESWLGRITDVGKEAVVNRSLTIENGGKSLTFYSDVMERAMREMARVLKPGGWATVVFHNTDAKVWSAIRSAASSAGFKFHEAASLDRRQQSHKGYKGRSGKEDVAHFDVVFNLRKTGKATSVARKKKEVDLRALVLEVARETNFASRGLQGIHSEVMRRLASYGSEIFMDYSIIREIWETEIELDAAE